MREESTFYPRTVEELNEMSRSFKVFDLIEEVTESFVKKLRREGLNKREFNDFGLGTMTALNKLNVGLSLDKFLREAYLGLSHVVFCLQSDKDLSDTSKHLLPHITNALNIIDYYFVQEPGTLLPNLQSEATHYRDNVLNHLSRLTDIYLRDKLDYEKLKPYRDLIKDFQVVSEIAQGLRGLQVMFTTRAAVLY